MQRTMTPPSATTNALPKGMIQVTFHSKESLQHAYMPFLLHGGIFVATEHDYAMGADVFLMLTLPENAGRQATAGKVVWVNPPLGHRPRGVGVAFDETPSSDRLRELLETLILGLPELGRAPTTL